MFLKKLLLLPLVLAFASNAALAANSVDLRVTGTITPSACDISVAGGGAFDLGSISSGDLAATTISERPAVGGQTLNIACSGATQVAFKSVDNRSGSLPTGSASNDFGLGVDSANNPIGSYKLYMLESSSMVDGVSGKLLYSIDSGASWVSPAGTEVSMDNDPSRLMALDSSSNGTDQPLPLTSASVALSVTPTIQPTNTLDTSTEISIDGSATIELVYL